MSRGIQYLKENLPRLPLDVREAIVNTEYLDGLQKVQEQNNLHIDQGEELEHLTFQLMLGDVTMEDFPKTLREELRLDNAQALLIVKQVDELVMLPIRKELEKIQAEEESIEATSISDKDIEEGHDHLNAADVLHDIENPHPAITMQHDTIKEVPVMHEVKEAPITIKHIAPQLSVQKPTSTQNAQSTPPTIMPAPHPIQTTTESLSNKLTESTVTKPEQIRSSIDPYKESFN